MLFADTIWMTLLGLWLFKVLPNEHGTKEVPYFFLTREFWTRNSRETSMVSGDLEVPLSEENEKLVISNLVKEFNGKKVVNDISLEMNKG